MPSNPSCTQCPLHNGSRAVCVWGTGDPNADIMLVGEALGAEEELQGMPFVGPAGIELDKILARIGIPRSSIWITNAAKCRPPGNRVPTTEEIKACSGYLLDEISTVRPKVVVALGSTAQGALAGKTKIGENRGKLLAPKPTVRLNGASLIGTYHPSAYLHQHNTATLDAIASDLQLAMKLAGIGPAADSMKSKKAMLYGDRLTVNNLDNVLTLLDGARVIAADLEWTGSKEESRIRWPWTPGTVAYCISLTGEIDGTYYTVGLASQVLYLPEFKDRLQAFFTKHPTIFHNAQADLLWLKALGFSIILGGDTMLLANLLDEGQGMSLEALATSKTTALPGWKKPAWAKAPATDEEWEELLLHNCGDTETTLMLAKSLYKELASRSPEEQANIRRLYRELVLPAIPTFVEVAFAGVPVDPTDIKVTIDNALTEVDNLAVQLGHLAELDPKQAEAVAMSPTKTAKLLRDRFNIQVSGTGKADLEQHGNTRAVQLIQGIRHERKFLGTYLNPWLELAGYDNRLHSIYRLAGARTGRTSAELELGGSLQVAPREDRIRRLIKARPGYQIVAADQSQVELRVAAWFANERTMLELYRNDEDLHKATAAFLIARRTEAVTVREFWPRRHEFIANLSKDGSDRQGAKGVNFGLVYGMGPDKLVDYVRQTYKVIMTLAQATEAREGYFALYSDLLTWHRKSIEDWQRLGYTVTPFGRYRRHITEVTQAINTPVQSVASDLTVFSMTEIQKDFSRRKLTATLIGFVHDSVMSEAPDNEVEIVSQIIKYHIENPPILRLGVSSIPVPLKADVKVGADWSKAA